MNKFERRMWFERLLELRAAYLSQSHAATGMTVEEAIRYGEALMADRDALTAALGADVSPMPGATTKPAG